MANDIPDTSDVISTIEVADSTLSREELNRLGATIIGPEPADESEHFYLCEDCGQAVDMRRLGDVFHHEKEGHEPIAANS